MRSLLTLLQQVTPHSHCNSNMSSVFIFISLFYSNDYHLLTRTPASNPQGYFFFFSLPFTFNAAYLYPTILLFTSLLFVNSLACFYSSVKADVKHWKKRQKQRALKTQSHTHIDTVRRSCVGTHVLCYNYSNVVCEISILPTVVFCERVFDEQRF